MIKNILYMKKTLLAFSAALFVYSGFAQTFVKRGRIENVTDYSALLRESNNGARRIGTRSSAALPCTGSPKIPVVLVQFDDKKFVDYDKDGVVNKRYNDAFNLKEGNASPSKGSVYQYFKEQSYGKFTPEFDVIGPVTLSNSYKHYGENNDALKDFRIQEFFQEACNLVVSGESREWKDYDNNNDGKVDMVFFIYAGEGENYNLNLPEEKRDSYLIWPKEQVRSTTVGSITFGAYGCTNELVGGVIDGIGTCVHELSHGLGLPDLYDTSNGPGLGVDAWDVMDGGNYQIGGNAPIGYSAYERDFMGWREIVTINKDEVVTLTLNPLETDGVAYKITNPANANEYFILENRQNVGYDEYMPWNYASTYKDNGGQHGLLITHVDYDNNAWTSNKINVDVNHQRYSIVPADGKQLSFLDATDETFPTFVESYKGDLYPGAKGVKAMSSYAVFKGGTLNQTIDNIREVDGVIYVDINGGTVIPALQAQLATDIATAKTYVGQKMGSSVAKKLNTAIANAEKVARDQDAIETVSAALAKAVKNAKNSINLYNKIAAVIAKAAELGEVGKASFEAAGIQKGYDEGSITSINPVNQAYDDAVAAQAEADAVAELKATLANDVTTAKTYVGKKMDKNVATALNSAIAAAESVGDTREAVNTASANLATAVTNATASIELYKKVLAVINKAAKLGDAGKASFKAAGIQTAYNNGTITSLDAVNKAYDDAVAAQAEADAVAELKATLANDVTTAKTYVGKKMDKNVATTLNTAIAAAENVGDTRDAVNTASANLSSAVTDATASIELYKKVAEYIAKVDALGEAAKASFADVQKAYNNGTITSLADVEAAYAEAVRAQEVANGIGDVTVDAKSQQIYTADGKATNTLGHGINIVKDAKGKTTKVLKK